MQSLVGTTPPRLSDADPVRAMRVRLVVRSVIILIVIVGTGVLIYFRLGPFQHMFKPATPPGGWVIDPPNFCRIFLSMYGPAFVAVPTIIRLKKKWNAQDEAQGTPAQPQRRAPILFTILGGVMVSFFAVLLVLTLTGYLLGFTTISSASIRSWHQLKLGYVDRPYAEVRAVVVLPDAYRLGNSATHGPRVRVQFNTGRDVEIGHENELTKLQVDAIAQYVSLYSGVAVTREPDATHQ